MAAHTLLFLLVTTTSQATGPAPATSPAEVIAQATAADWRPIAAEDLLALTLAGGGQVFLELAPAFAPVHVDNVRRLARAHWYDGSSVHRVQDNYVVQWGQVEGEPSHRALPEGFVEQPPAEYELALSAAQRDRFTPVQRGHYTEQSGYLDGWPIGVESRGEGVTGGLVHCYGMVGVGRDVAPDTGSGVELYAVIGHAPRHLDRNLAVIGRVVEGIERLSTLSRGTGELGFYERAEERVPIATVRLASELPESEQPRFRVLRTDTDIFRRYVEARAHRGPPFFVRPAGAVDVCNVLLPVERVPEG